MTTTAYAAAGASRERPNLPFIIGASSVGTLIEWYDFYLYGVLARLFQQAFLLAGARSRASPSSLSLFVFWTGFLVRPFGAIVFGHLGDLIGRKFTFMLTLLLMGAATFVVGLLPGYETIGVAGADPARRDARAAGSGAWAANMAARRPTSPSTRPTAGAGFIPPGSRPRRRWASFSRCW